MTIIRRKHNGRFTVVPNSIYDDRRLSIETKGVLGYLLSRPNNWQVRHRHLQTTLGVGRDRLQRIIRELIVAGYMERDEEQPRDEENHFASYNYVVRDEPAVALGSKSAPDAGFQATASRQRKSRIDNKNEGTKTKSTTSPNPQEGASDDVLPSASQGSEPEDFEAFWTDYPGHKAMDRERALAAFRLLTFGDQRWARGAAKPYGLELDRLMRKPVGAHRWLVRAGFKEFPEARPRPQPVGEAA